MSKKQMVKTFKLSETYPVYSSSVADEAKITESILICLMAERSRSHLVLANCFSGQT